MLGYIDACVFVNCIVFICIFHVFAYCVVCEYSMPAVCKVRVIQAWKRSGSISRILWHHTLFWFWTSGTVVTRVLVFWQRFSVRLHCQLFHLCSLCFLFMFRAICMCFAASRCYLTIVMQRLFFLTSCWTKSIIPSPPQLYTLCNNWNLFPSRLTLKLTILTGQQLRLTQWQWCRGRWVVFIQC